jgi:hypothetical protein
MPGEPYKYCEWHLRRVGIDYHVEIDAHYYSVPYRFARAEVEARLSVRGIEIYGSTPTTISTSSARAERGKVGSRAPSARKPAATIVPSSITAVDAAAFCTRS